MKVTYPPDHIFSAEKLSFVSIALIFILGNFDRSLWSTIPRLHGRCGCRTSILMKCAMVLLHGFKVHQSWNDANHMQQGVMW